MKEDKFAESKRTLVDLNSIKNEDVFLKIVNRDRTKYTKTIDYICAAIRAFDESKPDNLNMKELENVIEKMMDEKLKNINLQNSSGAKENVISLEDNIDEVNIDED